MIQVLPSTPMSTSTILESSPRSPFERRTFATLVRAMHPARRFATAVSRLAVGELDRQPDTATAWVYGAYATVLGRLPDGDGLRTYEELIRRGTNPAAVVAGMAASREANDNYFDAPADLEEVFVTGAYLVALGRRPDPAGAEAQREALQGRADHTEVLHSLLTSPEAQGQLRFPPAPPSPGELLARAVQEVVIGDVDPDVQRLLVRAVRDGRSVTWMVRTALRLRGGRRAMVRALPRSVWLGHLACRRATTTSVVAALETKAAWDWRIQRKLMNDIARLSRNVAELRGPSRTP